MRDQETVELEEESSDVLDTEDGGALIQMQDEEDAADHAAHFANIVEEVPLQALNSTVVTLLDAIERDKEARSKRDKLYEEGLRRTGLSDDAPGGAQFAGANKVVHPMLVEACVDFSARVMKELMPPNGPAKAKIYGDRDKKKLEKADRKTEFLNWQTTEQIKEFRGELEQLSTQLPLGGVQYMKLCWDASRERCVAEFVPVDDVYLPFAATNFYTAERKTHVIYITQAGYEKKVRAGQYIDINLTSPMEPDFSKAQEANDKIEGREQTGYNEDGLRKLFEICVTLDIEKKDEYRPYIITIDDSSRKAICLYRNWDMEDPLHQELEWMVEFPFVPWRGAYPIGLTHMIGSLSGAATGALRALLDSAHIQNMPTALKLKGGPNGQTLNLQPTQIADIEGNAMTDDIRKIVMPLPFNPPSPTLFQLLGFVVDAGKGVVQTSFEKLSDMNAQQPVGTTVALIEQGMVVFSSIHARLHSAMSRVLKVLHRINAANLTQEMIDAQAGGIQVQPSDFDGPMDVVPVSDPHIFSETQRFAQTQAVMQRAAAVPQLYDARKVEESFLQSMKVDTDILVPKPGEDDIDPASENVAMAMARPTYVLPKQDHIAHIRVHMAFMKSPLFGMNPVFEKKALPPMVEHLAQHLLNYYLVESHDAVKTANTEGLIAQDDASAEAKVIEQVQAIIEQEFGPFAEILPAMDQAAMRYMPQPPQDPAKEIATLNAQVQTKAIEQRAQESQQKTASDQQKKQLELADKDKQRQADITEVEIREQNANNRAAAEIESRETMNSADNQTAMLITERRLEEGKGSNLSTGTGINPNP